MPSPNRAEMSLQHLQADRLGEIPPGVHRDDLADPPLVDRLLGQRHAGIEPADVADHELPAAFVGRRDDLVAIVDARGHGLFEKDVLAGPQGVDRDVAMVVDVGDDADDVDRIVVEHPPVVGIPLGHVVAVAEFVEPGLAAGTQRGQLDARRGGQGVDVDFAEPSQSEHAPTDRL